MGKLKANLGRKTLNPLRTVNLRLRTKEKELSENFLVSSQRTVIPGLPQSETLQALPVMPAEAARVNVVMSTFTSPLSECFVCFNRVNKTLYVFTIVHSF